MYHLPMDFETWQLAAIRGLCSSSKLILAHSTRHTLAAKVGQVVVGGNHFVVVRLDRAALLLLLLTKGRNVAGHAVQ